MRAIIVFTILLLGLSGAALEPKYSLRGDDLRSSRDPIDGLVEIESSAHRSDRLNLAALGPRLLHVEVLRPELRDAPLRLASLNSDVGGASNDTPTAPPQPTSLDNLCNTASPRPRTTTCRCRSSPICFGRRAGCASMTSAKKARKALRNSCRKPRSRPGLPIHSTRCRRSPPRPAFYRPAPAIRQSWFC